MPIVPTARVKFDAVNLKAVVGVEDSWRRIETHQRERSRGENKQERTDPLFPDTTSLPPAPQSV